LISSFPGDGQVSEEGVRIGPWTRNSVATVYTNPWIQVEHHRVVDPAGRDGVYGVVRFRHRALGCVPLHADGTVTLVGQHRYPLDVWSWEIPEGGGSLVADPLEEMKRELAEETGFAAGEWIPLGLLHPSNSVSDEVATLWLARNLEPGTATPESTESDMRSTRVPFVQAVEMALDGRLTDAITVVALLRARHFLERESSTPRRPL